MSSTRDRRDRVRRATHILGAVLDAWDPIGVGPAWPVGEYDDVVPQLLAFLRTDPSPGELCDWLMDWASSDLELEASHEETLAVSRFIHMWWTRNKDSLPSGIIDSDPARQLP